MSENKFHSVSNDSPDLMSVKPRLNISRLNYSARTDRQPCTTKAFELAQIGFKKAGVMKKYIQERQMSTTNEFHEHTKINFTDRQSSSAIK